MPKSRQSDVWRRSGKEHLYVTYGRHVYVIVPARQGPGYRAHRKTASNAWDTGFWETLPAVHPSEQAAMWHIADEYYPQRMIGLCRVCSLTYPRPANTRGSECPNNCGRDGRRVAVETRAQADMSGILRASRTSSSDAQAAECVAAIEAALDSGGSHIEVSQELIRAALSVSRKPVIAWSGGKDSEVVRSLVHAVDGSVGMIHSDDEMYLPEDAEWIDTNRAINGPQLRIISGAGSVQAGWHRPWTDPPFWRAAPEGMEPSPQWEGEPAPLDRVAYTMGYDIVFLGVRALESQRRMADARTQGPVRRRYNVLWVNPLLSWSDAEVWGYIEDLMLPVSPTYARYAAMSLPVSEWRVGPLPLSPRRHLEDGWPKVLERAERRYNRRWRS